MERAPGFTACTRKLLDLTNEEGSCLPSLRPHAISASVQKASKLRSQSWRYREGALYLQEDSCFVSLTYSRHRYFSLSLRFSEECRKAIPLAIVVIFTTNCNDKGIPPFEVMQDDAPDDYGDAFLQPRPDYLYPITAVLPFTDCWAQYNDAFNEHPIHEQQADEECSTNITHVINNIWPQIGCQLPSPPSSRETPRLEQVQSSVCLCHIY